MNVFSTVDGFVVEITESLAEMIKQVANEPSVGLFYVQKHIQNAVPNVVNLNNNVVKKTREATLHTEDLEDSITMVRSMKECGFPVADDMIKDIKNSLMLMSAKQPKRGSIHSPASSFQMRRTGSRGPMSWGHGSGNVHQDGSYYFSTVIKSVKQKASNFKRPQLESGEQIQTEPWIPHPHPASPLSVASASTGSIPDTEADELPLFSQMVDELHEEEEKVESEDDVKLSSHKLSFVSENYDDFKADKEAKLEQWLEGTEGKGESDTGGL
ncbi:uncharacterized protein LOC111295205 [Durio zibethinus]|uniref:Uncharacterized protein LOC111295205 n=1 Tax=Durio zibethinus TaxID=66656 RepID=A0A6P5YUS0_DURZI|nr:uncharacterized protein LOC111295205 [Durio zibethinus]XP_022744333.1 uncharacterized protein LOC111295205 [Durio zibethinus]